MILFENRDNPCRGKSKNSAKPMRAARKTVCEAGERERASFLKKRSKKLLLNRDRAGETCCGPESQKFFGSFFKKELLLSFNKMLNAYRIPR